MSSVSETEAAAADGGEERRQAHTVRLELVDEPGELLNALRPIADNGGNLLSVFHERGSLTPRGHIPVEVDFESTPRQFEGIVDALRDAGVNITQAGTERYGEEVSVLLVGHLVETDLSDTLSRIEACASASVVDFSLTDEEGIDTVSSARMRLATSEGSVDDTLACVREVAADKQLQVVEPLAGGEA
ncbi:amino acid-binding protein [Halarchaeum sp. CBA1220]|uniref:amino acid-binding protein n=1 Tax=Halarchaeum sp. CBA1220 TaxID=1853682 RepID=UPI00351AB24A